MACRALIFLFGLSVSSAQDLRLQSNARLVLAPVAVTDHKGRYVHDLNLADLTLYDNNVPRKIHIEEEFLPVSLVVATQATQSAWEILNKLHLATSLFGPLITGDRGEAAVLGFAEDVRVIQDFTSDADLVSGALKRLTPIGDGGSAIDAVVKGVDLLSARPGPRRRVIVLISEKHDRSSKSQLEEAVSRAQKENIAIYPVTFSPSLSILTSHAPNYCDRKCLNCERSCKNCANECYRKKGEKSTHQIAPEVMPMNLLAVFLELKQLSKENIAEAFAKYTGGQEESFVKKSGLETALQRVGEDLHGQYVVSFDPGELRAGEFHPLRAEVKGRQDLIARTRAGYWAQ